ncbi:Superoxide dismutase, partial [Dipsacomyces acuminosporus]
PVPANGDCSATGNHWDPFKVKVADKPYKCDRKNAEKTCELGDLTGRHSKITGNRKGRHTARYHDSLISFNGTNSIIGHSIVIHGSDNKPLACANITLIEKNAKKPKDPKARKDGEASSVYSSIAYGAESKKSAAPASAVASISGFAALVAAAIAF